MTTSPTLPTVSTARTANVCSPRSSPGYVAGLVHGWKAPPSRLHSVPPTSPPPLSVAENANVAERSGVRFGGPSVSWVVGAVRSTVQSQVAGESSRLPAPSYARTARLCSPCARPEYVAGLPGQAENAAPSRLHS